MTRSISPESVFFSLVTRDWTIRDLLAWIAADDARCHDERLAPVLTMLLGTSAVSAVIRTSAPSTVVLVRALVVRVAAEPACGARRLGDVIAPAVPLATPTPREAEPRGLLVAV